MVTLKEIRELEADAAYSRALLSARWSSFEKEIVGLVQSASDEVSHKVQGAKDAVSITHHVNERPWSMVGGAVLAGLALSRFASGPGLVGLGMAAALSKANTSPENSSRYTRATSLADLAQGLVRRNVPAPFAPIIDRMIARAAERLRSHPPTVSPGNRVIDERGGSVLV